MSLFRSRQGHRVSDGRLAVVLGWPSGSSRHASSTGPGVGFQVYNVGTSWATEWRLQRQLRLRSLRSLRSLLRAAAQWRLRSLLFPPFFGGGGPRGFRTDRGALRQPRPPAHRSLKIEKQGELRWQILNVTCAVGGEIRLPGSCSDSIRGRHTAAPNCVQE